MQFSDGLITVIHETQWIFAKTYAATWPHEYLCRHYLEDMESFYNLVRHIREHSYEGRFYKRPVWYFEEDGYTYWTMARCRKAVKKGSKHRGEGKWRINGRYPIY